MSIVWALIVFSLIILFHECGHFLLAKLNGITVVEFSLGMGPRILSREWRGTRYSWKALPFGGSCMMLGEEEEAGEEGSFGSKSVWVRISVIAAGPLFNFILALVLSVIVVGNYGYDPALITDVTEGSPAAEAGLQAGDVVTKMNGKHIHLARELRNYLTFHPGEDVTLVYQRAGKSQSVRIRPVREEDGAYRMGVYTQAGFIRGSLPNTFRYGLYELKYCVDITVESLKMLVRGQAGVKDMSGPVGVVNIIGDTYEESAKIGLQAILANMLSIAILLSANLGVFNLLPIPALDGGRLVFLLLEAIRGRRIDPEKEAMVHFAGLMALMALMMVVLYNDVMRLF